MKYDHDLDQSLKNLDKDIIWPKDRQQHVRNKLIDDMRQNKTTRMPRRGNNKILPVFSFVVVIAIVTVIILSGIETKNIALHDTINQRTSGSKVDQTAQNIPDNDDESNANGHDGEDTENSDNVESIMPPENEDMHDDPSDSNDTAENNSQEHILTQTEIMEVIKGQMTSDLPFKLPTEITLPEGKHLTAVTSSNATSYEVIYYQHDEPIPINNKLLFSEDNPAEVVARIGVKRYDTQKEADHAVAYEAFDESMGDSIRLSEGLTGYQEADDESVWTHWNVGRWALTIHASSDNSEHGLSLAKEVIAYLDEYMLPAPRQHGYAHLDANHENSRIVWETETTVYTIDQINDPLQALKIAVNFE